MTRIMIIDNEQDTLDLMHSILKDYPYSIVTATSGRECLDKIESDKPDLVLLDIMMPDMSGWEVFKKIKKKDEMIKIAFVSVLEISEQRKKALLKEGLADYIMKPFTKDELLERIKSLIG